MPFKSHIYKSFKLLDPTSTSRVSGLGEFQKSLELNYFSDATLKNKGDLYPKIDLVLELNCSLNLIDVLGHSNKGLWGTNDKALSTMAKSFETLLTQNQDLDIDLQEVSLFLNDTNIVVKRIYENSIPEQFNHIITEIAKQYIHITKGLTEQPEEIFVPVFEDTIPEVNSKSIGKLEKTPTPLSYKEYWGIYLESQIDGLIFDVQNNKFIPANLDYCILDDNN